VLQGAGSCGIARADKISSVERFYEYLCIFPRFVELCLKHCACFSVVPELICYEGRTGSAKIVVGLRGKRKIYESRRKGCFLLIWLKTNSFYLLI